MDITDEVRVCPPPQLLFSCLNTKPMCHRYKPLLRLFPHLQRWFVSIWQNNIWINQNSSLSPDHFFHFFPSYNNDTTGYERCHLVSETSFGASVCAAVIVVFQAKMSNISRPQLLKCKDLLHFFVNYE